MRRLAFKIVTALLAACCARSIDAITLDLLLQQTVEKNPEIQKAKCALEQASGRRLVFRSVALPNATIGAIGGGQGGYRAGETSNKPFGFGLGNFTQPLFNAAIPASWRRGDIELLIAQQQLNAAVVEQLHTARVAFYTALFSHSLFGLRQEERGRLAEIASSQKSRYESGLADRNLFVGAEVQTRELDPRIAAAQRDYDGALLTLSQALGDDLGPDATLPEPEGELHYNPLDVDVEEATTSALERRPDLKLARLMVRAAGEDQRIIAAAYYPQVNLAVAGDYIPVSGVRRQSEGSPRRSDDFVSSEIRAGGAYTWRVVDNGKVSGAVGRQRAAREVNEILLHKMEADVSRDLSRIRNDLRAVKIKQKALMTASTAAEENAATLQQNLTAGVVSQFEFRRAENDLLEVRTGLLSLAYKQSVALAEWDRATGRYLQFVDDTAQHVQ